MNIPNVISLGRILIVPVCVWLILKDAIAAAFWLFVAAAISDAVDGFIAKRFDCVTKLGGYLDPIADKALLVSVFVSLGVEGYLPLWLIILVVFRDLLIISGAILYQTMTQSLSMEPLMISKINTTSQLVLVGFVMGDTAFQLSLGIMLDIGIIVVAATTFLSGAIYLWEWSRRAAEMEDPSILSSTQHTSNQDQHSDGDSVT